MKNVVGKPVQGENFFGRDAELQVLRRIAEDEHVLLLAPRRVGKTSLLFALERALGADDDGAVGVYVSVAAAQDETQFARTVLAAAHATEAGKRFRPNRLASWFGRGPRRIKAVQAATVGVEIEHVDLGPYQTEIADEFLAKLATSYQIELPAALRARICAQAEWLIPYHLQVIFSALRDQIDGGRPSELALDAALDALLARKVYFSYWHERLRGALGTPEDQHARALLAVCARDPDGATMATMRQALAASGAVADELIRWILEILVNDGYLVVAGRRWRFRSGLLRRYWRKHVT